MNILIDIGNTRVKYVMQADGNLSAIRTAKLTDIILNLETINDIQSIVIVAVSNQAIVDEIACWAKDRCIEFQQLKTQSKSFGVINGYQNYQQMGADRWIAVLGAQASYPNQNLLIVDSGTATTFDLLTSASQHLGGWIIPGIELMITSLFSNTDKVKGAINQVESLEFGLNTNDNVNFGCWATSKAAIDFAITQAERAGHKIEKVVFTGGNGEQLNSLCTYNSSFDEKLMFIGMQLYI